MVDLAQLVNDSLVRHGVETPLDPRRVQWSKWFRIEDSFSVLLVPSQPGLFALAEEMAVFRGASEPRDRHPERSEGSLIGGGKRMLALFEVSQTDDLGTSLGRLFLPGTPQCERLATGKCFARYTVIEEKLQREAAHAAFQQWLSQSAEAATGITSPPPQPLNSEASPAPGSSNNHPARNGPPGPFPSGF